MKTFLLLFAVSAFSQPWSGILPTTRAIDWSGAGVVGGIPTNRTQCGSTIAAYSGAATTINSAITACGDDQYVLLGAGTFTLSSGITFGGRSNVTLRGSGPDSTFLEFTNDVSCLGQFSVLCIPGNGLSYYGPGPPTNQTTWDSGYTQGTTSITVGSTTGLSVGMYIMLDGCNSGFSGSTCGTGSASIPSDDVVNCQTITTCTSENGGATPQRTKRAQREFIKVTNISGTTLTLEHGIRFPNWASVSDKGAWWGSSTAYSTRNGIEDLSANAFSSGAGAAVIVLIFTHNSWIKNVRSLYGPAPRTHVLMYQTAHSTVRDSYFYGSVDESSGPTHYGVEEFPGYDDLVENNIFQRRTSPFVMDGAVGTVISYNFTVQDTYLVSPTFMQASYYSHEGGNGFNLFEGNQGAAFKADVVHASSSLVTSFRGYYRGWETGKTSETIPAYLYALSRFYNLIGNVLGVAGYHTVYQDTPPCSGQTTIVKMGCGGPVDDDFVPDSTLRWGNYDVVTAANRWCGDSSNTGWATTCASTSEVPTGLTNYPVTVPATETLPASFYLASRPSWYAASIPFPAVGPDVTGGNVGQCSGGTMDKNAALVVGQCTGGGTLTASLAGGRVNANPAMRCYLSVMGGAADGSGGPLTFNANSCYAASPPAPPTIVTSTFIL